MEYSACLCRVGDYFRAESTVQPAAKMKVHWYAPEKWWGPTTTGVFVAEKMMIKENPGIVWRRVF